MYSSALCCCDDDDDDDDDDCMYVWMEDGKLPTAVIFFVGLLIERKIERKKEPCGKFMLVGYWYYFWSPYV